MHGSTPPHVAAYQGPACGGGDCIGGAGGGHWRCERQEKDLCSSASAAVTIMWRARVLKGALALAPKKRLRPRSPRRSH
jgi:hypothetical protein